MPNIDQFLDVDFTKYPQYVRGYLHVGDHRCAAYGDTTRLIPESEWQAEVAKIDAAGGGADLLVTRIYNQKQEGSCVANATSQSHEIMQAKQHGKDKVVHLSAMSLYKRIGSGPQSGAMVSDGLDEMAKTGILPLDNPENRARFGDKVMENTGWSNKYPADWQATAKRFRALEWTVIQSPQEMATALLNQHPVVVGRSGHSICYTRLMYKNGSPIVKYVNSWGDWGDAGFGYDSLGMWRSASGWAFALRSIVML